MYILNLVKQICLCSTGCEIYMQESHAFQSIDLLDAINESKNILETIHAIKDKISNDIKCLENYLRKINPPQDFHWNLPLIVFRLFEEDSILHLLQELDIEIKVVDDDQLQKHSGGNSFCIKVLQEVIYWSSQDKRLTYLKKESWGYACLTMDPYSIDPFYDLGAVRNQFTTIEEKPLIETKYKTREKISPHFPDFIRALKKQYEPVVRLSWD